MTNFFAKSPFYISIAVVVVIYILTFAFGLSIWIGHIALILLIIVVLLDGWQINAHGKSIEAYREVRDQLSLSDNQFVNYTIENNGYGNLEIEIIDELPIQLQKRSFIFNKTLSAQETITEKYKIRPLIRGLYSFGKLHLYISSTQLGFVQKRISYEIEKDVEVYPSFIQMKRYDLQIFNRVATLSGIKRVRRIGKTDEFEHVKNYTQGDNIRSINWKATSRRNELMINQYQDTRSQSVFCVIDKGRSMKMPFDELTLLDYAINSTLVLSNIILKKYDYAGLLTFNEKIHTYLKADNRSGQLTKITESLYREETGYKESNYQGLYFYLRKMVTRRSVLIMFSNFENAYDMRRALPYLRQLNRLHLLVIVFFTNTELLSASKREAERLSDIYSVTFAKKVLMEKDLIADELASYGIQSILSTPQDLSINVINKYLEIKAKRMV